jgi:AAA domain-containing protein
VLEGTKQQQAVEIEAGFDWDARRRENNTCVRDLFATEKGGRKRGARRGGQLWILHAQIAAELDASRSAPHVVCDRSVLDNYCYLVNKFGRQPQLEAWLGWWMKTYDLLTGVPPSAEEIQPDGFRSEDRAFQRRIHDLLNELLSDAAFSGVAERVVWLDGRDRHAWAERVFALALPIVRGAAPQKAAR